MKLSRRTMLKSGSTALLLPILEANSATAAVTHSTSGVAATHAPAIPKRLVFLPMGYGVDPEEWFPKKSQVGTNYDLPNSLKPFEEVKADFSILQNLTNRHSVNGHSGTANFLTSANTKSVPGRFTNSISCDQLAAEVLGRDTRHRSLAIASAASRSDGHGGRLGYASWGSEGKPVGVYRKLAALYNALFGDASASIAQVEAQLARKQSSLDALIDNAKKLNRQVSSADRDRIDEYFTTIRSIEQRLGKAQEWIDRPRPKPPFKRPGRVSGRKEIELVLDLMLVAMQSDSTRVMTYMLPTGGVLKGLKSKLNPHKMSHFGPGKPDIWELQKQRDLVFSELVAGFLKKLKATKERDGSSLLDHSLVAYGSCLRKGHNLKNGPLLLAGHGGGGLKQGQNLVFKENSTPLSNLWLSMIRHVGVKQNKFADSKRVLKEVGFN